MPGFFDKQIERMKQMALRIHLQKKNAVAGVESSAPPNNQKADAVKAYDARLAAATKLAQTLEQNLSGEMIEALKLSIENIRPLGKTLSSDNTYEKVGDFNEVLFLEMQNKLNGLIGKYLEPDSDPNMDIDELLTAAFKESPDRTSHNQLSTKEFEFIFKPAIAALEGEIELVKANKASYKSSVQVEPKSMDGVPNEADPVNKVESFLAEVRSELRRLLIDQVSMIKDPDLSRRLEDNIEAVLDRNAEQLSSLHEGIYDKKLMMANLYDSFIQHPKDKDSASLKDIKSSKNMPERFQEFWKLESNSSEVDVVFNAAKMHGAPEADGNKNRAMKQYHKGVKDLVSRIGDKALEFQSIHKARELRTQREATTPEVISTKSSTHR